MVELDSLDDIEVEEDPAGNEEPNSGEDMEPEGGEVLGGEDDNGEEEHGEGEEEGENEEGDDPMVEIPGSGGSSSIHMEAKRVWLLAMQDEIKALQARLGK